MMETTSFVLQAEATGSLDAFLKNLETSLSRKPWRWHLLQFDN
jgi:hypothetical protein